MKVKRKSQCVVDFQSCLVNEWMDGWNPPPATRGTRRGVLTARQAGTAANTNANEKKADVWGTKERKTQTLLCVPRLATRPILLVFRTPAVQCKHGSAELVYLGQVIYTRLSTRKRTHGARWLVLKVVELAVNLVLHTSGGSSGHWKPCLILNTTDVSIRSESSSLTYPPLPGTVATSRTSCRLRVPQPSCQLAGLKHWNEWLLAKGPVLPACTVSPTQGRIWW